jgi:hypothetical protein
MRNQTQVTKTPFIAPHVRIKSTLDRDEDAREPNIALTFRQMAKEKRRRRFWFGK